GVGEADDHEEAGAVVARIAALVEAGRAVDHFGCGHLGQQRRVRGRELGRVGRALGGARARYGEPAAALLEPLRLAERAEWIDAGALELGDRGPQRGDGW